MVYFIDKNLYETFKEIEDVAYVDKNLFYKKGDYYFFIKANTFNIELKDNYKLETKDISFEDFKVKLSNYQKNSIERIIEEKEFCFIIPNILSFNGAVEVFKHFFRKENIYISYVDILNDTDILKKALINYEPFQTNKENVENYLAVNLFDKFVINWFTQKTPVPYIVRGVHLCAEHLLNVEGLVYNVQTEYDIDTAYYLRDENIYHISNKWIFMDKILDEDILDVNSVKDIYPKEVTIVENNHHKYLLKEQYRNVTFKSPKRTLSIIFFLDTYFCYDELISVLDVMHDNLVLDKNNEVISYTPLLAGFNAVGYLEDILESPKEEKIELLNKLPGILHSVFPYSNYKEIFKCPYCIDGKIYTNNSFYICSHCDFRLYKKNKMVRLTKRLVRTLLKNKTTKAVIKNEIKPITLYKADNGWYNILIAKNKEEKKE